jgi:hypothetical protein
MPAKVVVQDHLTTKAAAAAVVAQLGLAPDAPSHLGQDQLVIPQAKADERMRRRKAREYLEDRLGRPVSDNTMIYTWGIPYYRDGRDAIYLRSVLDRFVAERIVKVSQQVFGSATDLDATPNKRNAARGI